MFMFSLFLVWYWIHCTIDYRRKQLGAFSMRKLKYYGQLLFSFWCMIIFIILIFIISAWPLLLFLRKRRQKMTVGLVSHAMSKTSAAATQKQHKSPHSSALADTRRHSEMEVDVKRKPPSTSKRSSAFIVLTSLTFSVIVCWSPTTIYFTIICFVWIDTPILFQTGMVLHAIQAALDPIFFTITLKDLRDSVRAIFSCGH